jgi:hypothetical protein
VSITYPQDWISSAGRSAIAREVHRRYIAYRHYEDSGADRSDLGHACRWLAEHRIDNASAEEVLSWVAAGGWWKGTRRGVRLELRWEHGEKDQVHWIAMLKKSRLEGYSDTAASALQDIGCAMNKRLREKFDEARAVKWVKEEAA